MRVDGISEAAVRRIERSIGSVLAPGEEVGAAGHFVEGVAGATGIGQIVGWLTRTLTFVTIVATSRRILIFERGILSTTRVNTDRLISESAVLTTEVRHDLGSLFIGGTRYSCSAAVAQGDARRIEAFARAQRSSGQVDWKRMIPCPHCGHENPAGRGGCGGCGRRFSLRTSGGGTDP